MSEPGDWTLGDVLDARREEREAIVAELENVAACEESLAEADRGDGDEEHWLMHRQNAWAFRKAAELVRKRT